MSTHRMGVLGKKLGMTQIFIDNGMRIPVTVVQAGGAVLGKRTPDKDGYAALILGFDEKPWRVTNKPDEGRFKKAEVPALRFVRELRVADVKALEGYEIGQKVDLSKLFHEGGFVDVSGRTKGKGYQGVMKRHGMPGFKRTHGTHEFFRHGGSIGCRLTPGRVHKGKRMSGHMGDANMTMQSVALMKIMAEEGLLLLRGAVPGGKNGYLVVRGAVKKPTQNWRAKVEMQETASKNPMKASKAAAGAKKAAKK